MIEEIKLFVWIWLSIGLLGTMFIWFQEKIKTLATLEKHTPKTFLGLSWYILLGPLTIIVVSKKSMK